MEVEAVTSLCAHLSSKMDSHSSKNSSASWILASRKMKRMASPASLLPSDGKLISRTAAPQETASASARKLLSHELHGWMFLPGAAVQTRDTEALHCTRVLALEIAVAESQGSPFLCTCSATALHIIVLPTPEGPWNRSTTPPPPPPAGATASMKMKRWLMSQHSLGRKPITNPAATQATAATRYQTEQPGRRVSSAKYGTCTAVRLEQLAHFLVRRKVLHRFHDQRLLLRRQHHVLEVHLRREVLQCGACIRVNLT